MFLYLLNYKAIFILLAALAGLYFIWLTIKTRRIFDGKPLSKLRNYESSPKQFYIKKTFLIASLIFLALAMLRPQWGVKTSTSEASGVDVVFAMDVSNSMKALDLSMNGNTVDRLTMAKSMVKDFVDNNPGNRYGLVVFAGEAFVSTPLTFDNSAFLTFLEGVSYEDVSKQGTDLGQALKASLGRFVNKDSEKRGKVIVLITDGGDDETSNYDDFAQVAKKDGIPVYAIGIGSDKGVAIPDSKDFFGRISYKTYQGKTVLTKLNEKPLKDIAGTTGGKYFQAKQGSDLRRITKDLSSMQKTTIKRDEKNGKEDKYQYFLLPAFLFFLFSLFLPDKKILPLLLVSIFVLSGCSVNPAFRYYNQKANDEYGKEYFPDAKKDYSKAEKYSKEFSYIAKNNKAIVEYAERDYTQVAVDIEGIVKEKCQDNAVKYCDQVFYNLGNAYYRIGEGQDDFSEKKDSWEKAIKSYEKDLAINKEDVAAQENIDFIKQKLSELEEGQKKDGSQNQSGQNQQGQEQNSQEKNEEKQDGQGQGGEAKDDQKKDGNGSSGEQKKGEQDNKNSSGEQQNNQSQDGQKQGEQGQDGQKQGENSQSSDASAKNIDEQTQKQVEQYMKQMEDNSASLQQYFRQNKNKQDNASNDPFDDFFDDPFFKQMMGGDQFGGQFKNNSTDPNAKDW
jgi:Ca-activated chloride channel family protein